jgi:hypothetical protein
MSKKQSWKAVKLIENVWQLLQNWWFLIVGHLLLVLGCYHVTLGLYQLHAAEKIAVTPSVVLKSPLFWGLILILGGICFLRAPVALKILLGT